MHISIANTKSHFYYKNEQNVASIKMVVFFTNSQYFIIFVKSETSPRGLLTER